MSINLLMNTDPIADLITRIRNASMAGKTSTVVPASKIKSEILKVMKEKELIADFQKGEEQMIIISLHPNKELSLKRISKPGQRIYRKAKELFPVLRGYGISIISTSQGVMTGEEAKKKGLGGELICEAH
jgi:small subunit ribosomal protein S8